MQITQNQLLGGRISLLQPQDGYRAAIDPVFLAAALNPKPQDCVLEVGAGVGAAMLCLAARVPGCRVTGFEIQKELVELGTQNIIDNKFENRLDLIQGDLRHPPSGLIAGTFHHVMANPPYVADNCAFASPNLCKALAHHEGEVKLEEWVNFCLKMLRPKGSLTLIHRADRLGDVLRAVNGKLGELHIFPLWPKQNKPAKRILVRGRKGVASPDCLKGGMILHREDGSYTHEAEAILREGRGVFMSRD